MNCVKINKSCSFYNFSGQLFRLTKQFLPIKVKKTPQNTGEFFYYYNSFLFFNDHFLQPVCLILHNEHICSCNNRWVKVN
jgi:hypothetical protein